MWSDFWIAVAGGVATAAFLWLLTRMFTPRIRWSAEISVIPATQTASGYRYRVKVENASILRPIVDLRLRADILFFGLTDDDAHGSWFRAPIEMTYEDTAFFPARTTKIVQVEAVLSEQSLSRLRDMGLIDEVASTILPEHRRLGQMLALNERNYLIVGGLGKDGWSGRETYCRSPHYARAAICHNHFLKEENVLELQQRRIRRKSREWGDKRRTGLKINAQSDTGVDVDLC